MYMTRSEMAKELIYCMSLINEKDAEIARLNGKIDLLLASKPDPSLASEEVMFSVVEFGDESANMNEVFDQLMKDPEIDILVGTPEEVADYIRNGPVIGPIIGPDEVPEPVTEKAIVENIRRNLDVEKPAPNSVTALPAHCSRCDQDFTYPCTQRGPIPTMCLPCKRAEKAEMKKGSRSCSYGKLPKYEDKTEGVSSYEPFYAMMKRTCATCVFGKFCAESTTKYECMDNKGLTCKPGVVGANYLAR